jgi:anti-sigma regulatory factor (Ser/Thr protein kinase)
MSRARQIFLAEPAAIPQVHDFVRETLAANGVDAAPINDLVLACDEAATNIVEHAFEGKHADMKPKPRFALTLNCLRHKVTATFFDSGNTFNMQTVAPPDISKNLAGERRGGYGVFLIRKLVDKIVYSARRRLNVTRLTKDVQG